VWSDFKVHTKLFIIYNVACCDLPIPLIYSIEEMVKSLNNFGNAPYNLAYIDYSTKYYLCLYPVSTYSAVND